MDALLRFLNRPVVLRSASPRTRRVLWLLLSGWVMLNAADWATTVAVLARAGSHEGNPIQAALLAHGGLVALAGYKIVVIAGGLVLPLLGFRLWPRFFVALMALCDLLVAAVMCSCTQPHASRTCLVPMVMTVPKGMLAPGTISSSVLAGGSQYCKSFCKSFCKLWLDISGASAYSAFRACLIPVSPRSAACSHSRGRLLFVVVMALALLNSGG